MADRDALPSAPKKGERKRMETAFLESAAYDGTAHSRSLRDQIKRGLVVFKSPDKLQLTKQGFDYLAPHSD